MPGCRLTCTLQIRLSKPIMLQCFNSQLLLEYCDVWLWIDMHTTNTSIKAVNVTVFCCLYYYWSIVMSGYGLTCTLLMFYQSTTTGVL